MRWWRMLPGTLVPSATKAMAVTESFSPTEQPKEEATSPITAVSTPIQTIDITKQSQPPIRSTGDHQGLMRRIGWSIDNPQQAQNNNNTKQKPNPRKKKTTKKKQSNGLVNFELFSSLVSLSLSWYIDWLIDWKQWIEENKSWNIYKEWSINGERQKRKMIKRAFRRYLDEWSTSKS